MQFNRLTIIINYSGLPLFDSKKPLNCETKSNEIIFLLRIEPL